MYIKAEIRVQERIELQTKTYVLRDESGDLVNRPYPVGTSKIKPSKKDIDGFFTAKTENDFEKLKVHYSAQALSFYGNQGAALEKVSDPESGGESWQDYENYKKLLETSRILHRLIETRFIYKGHLKEAGIVIESNGGKPRRLSVSVSLKMGDSTFLYLKNGAHHCMKLGLGCYLIPPFRDPEFSEFKLELSAPLDFDNAKKDESRIYHEGCLALQNTLNTLMLQDLRLAWLPNNNLELVSPSLASSLWCTLLGTFQKGRVGVCPVCSNEFIAQDRGNRKRFCSDACRKKNERYKKYARLVGKGLDEKRAAKQAKVKLEDAKDFWMRQTNNTAS